jgi:hypothetical protein
MPCLPLALCLAWTLVSLRLGFELRASRLALAMLTAGTACYFAVALLETLQPLHQGPLVQTMAHSAALMTGHLFVFLAVTLYGRHVYFESQGRRDAASSGNQRAAAGGTAKKPSQAAGTSAPSDEGEPEAASAGAEARVRPGKAKSTERKQAAASQQADVVSFEKARQEVGQHHEPTDDAGLSKSERRRRRKEKRRQEQRRAA